MQRLPIFAVLTAAGFLAAPAHAATNELSPDAEFDKILTLDLPDLMVTSVAKHEQKLTEAPAAIYVITQEDLWRTGATSIPEALRMVPGVEVAKVASNKWAISARGFNGALSNKLQVLIDGRSVYTPVFSGVYWDDQGTLIQDIERIEVIRGPGASLYGANAVNGVINIITKHTSETQGNHVSAIGSVNGGIVEGRHGGRISESSTYRVYGQYQDAGQTKNMSGGVNPDDWYRARTGFRVDSKAQGSRDSYTLQGDAYGGRQDTLSTVYDFTAPLVQTITSQDVSYGGNLLGRWTRELSKDSQMSLQGYVDYYARQEAIAEQYVGTADIQLQHNMRLDERNNFVWGTGIHLYTENLNGTFSATFNDRYSNHEIISAFAQDEYELIENTLFVTAGSKFEYNDFTGFEVQPTARLSWHPTDNQTLWGAVSRAVRTPSSIENDVSLAFGVTPGAPPTVSRIIGTSSQKSEELIAYEIGHRIQPTATVSFDTALYYNDYSKLLTFSPAGTGFLAADGNSFIVPFYATNQGKGHVYGGEFAANWDVTRNWRLTGSYTFTKMDLDEANTTPTVEGSENLVPRHQFSIRSYYNFSDRWHWDNMLYYVDKLATPVEAYLRYDTRISWLAQPGLEVSLIGRNLLDSSHPEFPATYQAQINRAIVGQVSWKF